MIRHPRIHAPCASSLLRHTRFELLEPRLVMTTTLAPIADVTLFTGAPLHIALDGFDNENDALTYTVSVSGNDALTARVLDGNRSLRMSIEGYGDMVFELFEDRAPRTTARIIELAEDDFYDGLTFHRVLEDFMIQGGDPTGTGSGGSELGDFDDEFHPELQHTNPALLSMAKGYDDGNDSQFFITAASTRWLDFNHSIFGVLTEGETVRAAIAAVEVTYQPDPNPNDDQPPEKSKPTVPIVISSVTVFEDHENGVLVLSAPAGTTGEADVTVTVSDGQDPIATETFRVTIQPDATDNYPYLVPLEPIDTSQDTPVEIDLEAIDVDGGAVFFGYDPNSLDPDLEVTLDSASGLLKVTPKNGLIGVHEIRVGVRPEDPADYYQGRDVWDIQSVPVFITPAPPAAIHLAEGYDTGSNPNDLKTSKNNDPADPLKFVLSGVVPGAEVTLSIGGVVVGQATAQGDTVEITADGYGQLPNGVYAVTAWQILLAQEVKVGNRDDLVDLESGTTLVQMTVDTKAPVIISVPITQGAEGRLYEYDVDADEELGGGLIYELVEGPAGMQIPNAADGKIVWTPAAGQAGTHQVVVKVTDAAGNFSQEYSEQAFEIEVAEAPQINPISPQTIDEGTELRFTVTATGGVSPLVFSLDPGPATGALIDPVTGEFAWTPGETFGPSERQVTIRVTDAIGASATRTVSIKIYEVNQLPQVAEIPDFTVDEGETLIFDVVAKDLDWPAARLAYQLLGQVPEGASLDFDSGRFQWTPQESQGGQTYQMTVRVWESNGVTPVDRTFTVTVDEVDQAPAFAPVEGQRLHRGDRLEMSISASDPDLPNHEVRYSLEPDAPEGAAIDPLTGRLTWDVPEDQSFGSIQLNVRATELLDEGQFGASSTLAVPVEVVAELPVTPGEIALLLLSRKSGGAAGDSDASDGQSPEAAAASLVSIDFFTSSDVAAPAAETSAGLPVDDQATASPLWGPSIFGTQFDPGSSAGGGELGSQQEQPPAEGAAPAGQVSILREETGRAKKPSVEENARRQADEPDPGAEQVPPSAELADAAVEELAEAASAAEADPRFAQAPSRPERS